MEDPTGSSSTAFANSAKAFEAAVTVRLAFNPGAVTKWPPTNTVSRCFLSDSALANNGTKVASVVGGFVFNSLTTLLNDSVSEAMSLILVSSVLILT